MFEYFIFAGTYFLLWGEKTKRQLLRRRRRKGERKTVRPFFYVHLKYKWETLFKGTFVIPSFIARNSISYARTTFLFAHSAPDTDGQQTYLTAGQKPVLQNWNAQLCENARCNYTHLVRSLWPLKVCLFPQLLKYLFVSKLYSSLCRIWHQFTTHANHLHLQVIIKVRVKYPLQKK